MAEYIIFLAISAATSFSPGPAVFLSIRNGGAYGLRKAFCGVLGNTLGVIILATCSVLGVSTILLASAALFFAIKILGGCYLIYLGIRIWLSKSPTNIAIAEIGGALNTQRSNLSIFKEAFFVCVTNPKAIIFFTALFPQFIDPSENISGQFIILMIGFISQSMICMTSYAAISAKLHLKLQNTRLMSWLNKVTGTIFMIFGAAMLRFSK